MLFCFSEVALKKFENHNLRNTSGGKIHSCQTSREEEIEIEIVK